MHDELISVLAEFGYKLGEINDALKAVMRNKVSSSKSGYVFTREGLPISLTERWLSFAEYPRDWDVFTFVQTMLTELAREKGLAKARVGIGVVYLEGENRGLDRHQLSLAIHGCH